MEIYGKELTYCYQENTTFAQKALDQCNLAIAKGSYTAIVGHTGSGKSTLVKMLNGLLQPQEGNLVIADRFHLPVNEKEVSLRSLRQYVGLVFQFPEAQLFEETVLKDVMFGPKNFGLTEAEAQAKAEKALVAVGIEESLYKRSPFELSGGQMRRVAIAGILALEPSVLVLDEPTAGLDPEGHKEMLELFAQLNQAGLTLILVTHYMDDVALYAERVLVMEEGKKIADTTPQKLFQDEEFLKAHHLDEPMVTHFARKLQKRGCYFKTLPLRLEELLAQVGGKKDE